jgi:hypothetical protein
MILAQDDYLLGRAGLAAYLSHILGSHLFQLMLPKINAKDIPPWQVNISQLRKEKIVEYLPRLQPDMFVLVVQLTRKFFFAVSNIT